ncbi:hypothetical protein SLEP1_g24879 [Rubroshorea leprosula]|uniref:Mechanosensitive ion channel protein n=1 Tax=Rubroshorea leprosula TaxID=152421 RepID=A0AAV5JT63_9ROSI|nr:hypothetical protein SLEP1_g24879 [Rubroshorea leprosula]
MAEKTGAEKLDDIETGNTETDSCSMNIEIPKASASTPTEPPTSATPHENPVRKESANTKKSKKWETLEVILATVAVSVFGVISLVCSIVYKIVAPTKFTIWVLLEWIALFCFTGFLFAILSSYKLQNDLIWEFELWKWCVMIMVLVCGRMVSEWIVNAVFLLTGWLFADKIKVYYFVYGLKKKHGVFVWWGLVLLAWLLLVDENEGERAGRWRLKETRDILVFITRVIVSLFIGAGLWLAKDLLVWSIARSFQTEKLFDRIMNAKFHQHVIKLLLEVPWYMRMGMRRSGRHRLFNWAEEIRKGKKSAISIKTFIDVISSHDDKLKLEGKDAESITNEIFKNRRAMEELEKIVTGMVLVVIILVWLVMLKVLTTQAVIVILTQFFVLAFMFGETCKRIFEGVVFLFATRPFGIGDRCVIEDGDEMFVKEINIQTTVFSRDPVGLKDDDDDKARIVYPNSVLSGKYIRNFQKIPAPPKLSLTESAEFVVDASTSIKQIQDLKARIESDMKTMEWIKDISVRANGFENGDKIKMTVNVTYKHLGTKDERNDWKSEMILGLKQILEDMGISKFTPQVEPPPVPAF